LEYDLEHPILQELRLAAVCDIKMHQIDIRIGHMAAMTIRKLSEAAVANIKLRAKANGRSAEAEARLALEEKFESAKATKSLFDVVEQWKLRNGGGIDLPVLPRNKDVIELPDFE
jgi:plasmid stability protein